MLLYIGKEQMGKGKKLLKKSICNLKTDILLNGIASKIDFFFRIN